jgi:hypothetical protein
VGLVLALVLPFNTLIPGAILAALTWQSSQGGGPDEDVGAAGFGVGSAMTGVGLLKFLL